ncbi:hypothetical protein [Fibrobacter sp. UWB11]|uniref:hypothetical protein n=1 Tax=Fibrobacter sp. UWB11 TaxID=1896202 RepID=UPI00092B7CC2|nr:hypothetical protein [Fibrobacter sp. UWB11]SIO08163.1 hypothetical protein SAMN05720758_1322 [Fibrobacter sp. UWB11]
MKIEKKKVVKSSKLSNFAKSAVATALGIAASFGTTACDDSISATGSANKTQEPEPTCGEVACGDQFSSSSYTDIPSSGERLSSEAIEALSSAKQPSSSSIDTPISSGVPHISSPSSSERLSSSSVEKPSSSSYEPIIEAGVLPPYEESSSSETPSSSSEEKSSSSEADIPDPRIIPVIDTLSPRIHLCEDPNNPGCLIESMVTTFEQDDVQA